MFSSNLHILSCKPVTIQRLSTVMDLNGVRLSKVKIATKRYNYEKDKIKLIEEQHLTDKQSDKRDMRMQFSLRINMIPFGAFPIDSIETMNSSKRVDEGG